MTSASHRIWFDRPATRWMSEALPVGNGRLGAMVFGGAPEERIQFNEATLWSGDRAPCERPEARAALAVVREHLFGGRVAEAEALAERDMTVPEAGFGYYQAFGDILVSGLPPAEAGSYRRELDLAQAVARTAYRTAHGAHAREVFASAADGVLVARFTQSQGGGLHVRVRLATPHADVHVRAEGATLELSGHNGSMAFQALLHAEARGGVVEAEGSTLVVHGAVELVLRLVAATDYAPEPPAYRQDPFEPGLARRMAALVALPVAELWRRHLEDHAPRYQRCVLDLGDGQPPGPDLPMDEWLRRTADGGPDPALAALVFHLGRYLALASSRPGGPPSNLQGLWADSLTPPWHCDYHLNINLQMNYWPVEPAALPECAEPLLDYIDLLREAGRRTARVHYGCRGWVVHWASNPWGRTTPGWSSSWGLFHAAAAWLALHAWEHCQFSADADLLRRRVFPLLRETCEFYFDFLTEDPDTGCLCTAPSVSPENPYVDPASGRPVFLCRAPAMDIQILRELFQASLAAAGLVGGGEADRFAAECRSVAARLPDHRVGRDGRLLEWERDYEEVDPHHRHVSHLFALHPGTQISPLRTPKLAEAARKTLERRGDDGTGWSKAWKIAFWARLHDGIRAHKLFSEMLERIEETDVIDYHHGGVYSNLLCAHPPFQVDGNLGAAAGIAEMLLQSHLDEIHLLPALPPAWPEGGFRGLRARGGFVVDAAWRGGVAASCRIQATAPRRCRLRVPGVLDAAGLPADARRIEADVWEWGMQAGDAVRLVFSPAGPADPDAVGAVVPSAEDWAK